ncbi:MAG: MFS transporter, partial [Candidatus Omnitrophota bacterium]
MKSIKNNQIISLISYNPPQRNSIDPKVGVRSVENSASGDFRQRDGRNFKGRSSWSFKQSMLCKIVACSLILCFTINTLAYGFDSDTFDRIRALESGKMSEMVRQALAPSADDTQPLSQLKQSKQVRTDKNGSPYSTQDAGSAGTSTADYTQPDPQSDTGQGDRSEKSGSITRGSVTLFSSGIAAVPAIAEIALLSGLSGWHIAGILLNVVAVPFVVWSAYVLVKRLPRGKDVSVGGKALAASMITGLTAVAMFWVYISSGIVLQAGDPALFILSWMAGCVVLASSATYVLVDRIWGWFKAGRIEPQKIEDRKEKKILQRLSKALDEKREAKVALNEYGRWYRKAQDAMAVHTAEAHSAKLEEDEPIEPNYIDEENTTNDTDADPMLGLGIVRDGYIYSATSRHRSGDRWDTRENILFDKESDPTLKLYLERARDAIQSVPMRQEAEKKIDALERKFNLTIKDEERSILIAVYVLIELLRSDFDVSEAADTAFKAFLSNSSNKGRVIRIGDIMKGSLFHGHRYMVCRHIAPLMQYILQDLGILSELRRGRRDYGGRHIWIKIHVEGGRQWRVDPAKDKIALYDFADPYRTQLSVADTRKQEADISIRMRRVLRKRSLATVMSEMLILSRIYEDRARRLTAVFDKADANVKAIRETELASTSTAMVINGSGGVDLSRAIGFFDQSVKERKKPGDYKKLLAEDGELADGVAGYTGESWRIGPLIHQQGPYQRQSVAELISNAVDSLMPPEIVKMGRFGIGAFQSLGELEEEGDYVQWTTSTNGKSGYRITIMKVEGEDEYRLSRENVTKDVAKGTSVRVWKKKYTGTDQKELREYIMSKFYL